MNIVADRHEQSHEWETHLCSEIHKKVELIIEDSRSLRVCRSDGDNYKVLDENNNTISLHMRKC